MLLKKLYEPERIQNEIDQLLNQTAASTAVDVFNNVSQQVAELSAKFREQKKVLAMVIHGLSFARPWILSLQPWGPLGITAVYLVGMGYIVYAGGDYIDWYRTGPSERLSFVPGIRTVVRQSLTVT